MWRWCPVRPVENMGGGGSTAKAKPKFSQKYMIAGELGRGAFSVVRLGVDKVNGEKRAIKIIQKKDLNNEDLSSLQDEINILKGIDHKNIIKLFETFEEGNELFMVTELVEGGELFDRIVAKTSYTEKEARDVIRVVLETIAALHDMDIVHRDLKPENLLLCSGEYFPLMRPCAFKVSQSLMQPSGMKTTFQNPI